MKEWNKTIDYHFVTDFNVDKSQHIQLFLMAKNGVLVDYILSLIEKDMRENNNPLLDQTICNQIILKEMGYQSGETSATIDEFYKDKLADLTKSKVQREASLIKENENLLSKQFENKLYQSTQQTQKAQSCDEETQPTQEKESESEVTKVEDEKAIQEAKQREIDNMYSQAAENMSTDQQNMFNSFISS